MKFFNLFRSKKPAPIEPGKPQLKPAKHMQGGLMFKIDLQTFDITECDGSSVIPEPGFWYCAALNKKNAEKHFLKMAKNQ